MESKVTPDNTESAKAPGLRYTTLEEEGEPSEDGHGPPASSEERDCNISVRLQDDSSVPSNEYCCTVKSFLCGLSLRCGCITIAILYSLYSLFYLAIAFLFLVMYDSYGGMVSPKMNQKTPFLPLWNLNMALFEAYFIIFTLVLLCLGIHKYDYRRLLVAKWTSVVYLAVNVVIQLRLILLDQWVYFFVNLCVGLIPQALAIIILHSYEAELWQIHKRIPGIPSLLKFPPTLDDRNKPKKSHF